MGEGDFEVALGDRHLGIQLDGDAEPVDRLLDQPLLEIEYAEVVVGPGIGTIDAVGEGAKDLGVPFHLIQLHAALSRCERRQRSS